MRHAAEFANPWLDFTRMIQNSAEEETTDQH